MFVKLGSLLHYDSDFVFQFVALSVVGGIVLLLMWMGTDAKKLF